jgi:hypothetical protein
VDKADVATSRRSAAMSEDIDQDTEDAAIERCENCGDGSRDVAELRREGDRSKQGTMGEVDSAMKSTNRRQVTVSMVTFRRVEEENDSRRIKH